MKVSELFSTKRPSSAQIVGVTLAVVGVILLVLAYAAQSKVDQIGTTNDPLLKERVTTFESQRDVYLVTGIGTVFMGLFAIAILRESSMPALVSSAAMASTARSAIDSLRGFALKGNASFLPARHGLRKERMMVAAAPGTVTAPSVLTDELVVSPGHDGSTPGILIEPQGLSLLDRIETELNTKLEGAGLEAAEGSLQILKHGLSMIRDFHFKDRDGKTILRVEYSGLLESCRSVRADVPDVCRQHPCIGCSCLMLAAARSTGKMVMIESVDNKQDNVVFTLALKDW